MAPFQLTPAAASCPVLFSVPHAGRSYAPGLLAAARVAPAALGLLEDPLVDRLIEAAVAAGAGACVALHPRAEIDLNRGPEDLDPAMIEGRCEDAPPVPSRRARGGLGLVPSRLQGHGALWRRPLAARELRRRIEEIHFPYHEAIADELARLRAFHGEAILIDGHSMPAGNADIVVGDLHGASCRGDLAGLAMECAADAGFSVARNSPYAGGYTLERHGRPDRGIHALQIEISRPLYLSPTGKALGPGAARVAGLLASLVTHMGAHLHEPALLQAAE